jgi:hypothetical protein
LTFPPFDFLKLAKIEWGKAVNGSAAAKRKKLSFAWESPFGNPVQTATSERFVAKEKSGKTATQKLPFAGLKGIDSYKVTAADSVRSA